MELLSPVFDHLKTLAFAVTVILLASAEIGYRLGLRLHKAADEPLRSQIAALQAAVLGMLGLIVGFTFSMAIDRFESRRHLVIEEANTIGTTWLRAGLLADVHRDGVRDLLRNYVDLRIVPQDTRPDDRWRLAEGVQRSGEI